MKYKKKLLYVKNVIYYMENSLYFFQYIPKKKIFTVVTRGRKKYSLKTYEIL